MSSDRQAEGEGGRPARPRLPPQAADRRPHRGDRGPPAQGRRGVAGGHRQPAGDHRQRRHRLDRQPRVRDAALHPLWRARPVRGPHPRSQAARYPWIDFDYPPSIPIDETRRSLEAILGQFGGTASPAITVLRLGAAGLFTLAAGPWLAWLPLDLLERLPGDPSGPCRSTSAASAIAPASSPDARPKTCRRFARSNRPCATSHPDARNRRPLTGSRAALPVKALATRDSILPRPSCLAILYQGGPADDGDNTDRRLLSLCIAEVQIFPESKLRWLL